MWQILWELKGARYLAPSGPLRVGDVLIVELAGAMLRFSLLLYVLLLFRAARAPLLR
jgi:hypothetical protein